MHLRNVGSFQALSFDDCRHAHDNIYNMYI